MFIHNYIYSKSFCTLAENLFVFIRWGLWRSFRDKRERSSWSLLSAAASTMSSWTKTSTLDSCQMKRSVMFPPCHMRWWWSQPIFNPFISNLSVLLFLYVCIYSAEIQRGHDQSQVPVDSCGKPCDPQQGPHLGEVSQSRPQEMF